MKKKYLLLLIALIFNTHIALSQQRQQLAYANTAVWVPGWLLVDSGLVMPHVLPYLTTYKKIGQFYIDIAHDSAVEVWNGSGWMRLLKTSDTAGHWLTTAVTSVTAGAGLSGGTIITTGTISMPNVGTSGTYGNTTHVPVITTDAQGRVSSVTSTLIDYSWLNLIGVPTTVAGYGITDVYTKTASDARYAPVSVVGTVTSVGLSVPAIFNTSGSPVNTSGTFTVTSANENANYIWAGPTTGTATTPAFRALVGADIPTTTVTVGTYGSATVIPGFTVDNTGRITGVTTYTISASGTVTNVTGTTNQIDVATGTTTPVISLHSGGTLPGTWDLGIPASGTLTNCTGLPVGGISATGVASSSTYLRGDWTWATITSGASTTLVAGSGINLVAGTNVYTVSIPASGVTNTMLAGSIAASKLVGSDIATVGTVTTGTWAATSITYAHLTLTNSVVAGDLATSGTASVATFLRGDYSWASSEDGLAANTANIAGFNTTETVVVQTPAIPANSFQVGTLIKGVLTGTCTSTASGNSITVTARIGTAGTTSDGICSQVVVSGSSSASGTANGFRIEYELTVTAIGSSASATGSMTLINNQAIGISGTATQRVNATTTTAFNSTTNNNIVSFTVKTGAVTTTVGFQPNSYIQRLYK